MRRSLCKGLFTSNWGPFSNLSNTHLTHFPFPWSNFPYSSSKPLSSSSSSSSESTFVTEDDELGQSYVVSYLINSCGLSPDRAVSICLVYGRRLTFDSSKKPDTVIAFLSNHGFSDAHITRMVSTDPRVLLSSEKTLLTMFQFYYSIGFTKQDLPSFLSKFDLRRNSLRTYMIPLYGLLKDVLDSDKEVVHSLKRMGWLLQKSGYKSLRPNLTLLKEIGVPDSKIALLLRNSPSDFLISSDEFRRIVDEVKELGFDVCKSMFVLAIRALNSSFRTTRDRCSRIYKEWGFSQKDILSTFKKWPQCLQLSEKKLTESLDFLLNIMGCRVEAITRNPQMLCFSLEERIIPRCSVIHVLIQKGLFKKDGSLYFAMCIAKKDFFDRYVYKYPDIAVHLLMVYQRKLDPFKESAI